MISRSQIKGKKYTLLIRKLTIEHNLLFASVTKNTGELKAINASSQCVINQQLSFNLIEDGTPNPSIQLHLLNLIQGQEIEIGNICFDMKSQKILKPLSKQFFSKQFNNKRGYIQYKFIGMENKSFTQQESQLQTQNKNNLVLRIDQHRANRQQFNYLMSLINQKDDIIAKMEQQISKLLKQTKKLNKSLSKQKGSQQVQRNISLSVKFNPNSLLQHKTSKSSLTKQKQWQKQKNEYQYEIQKMLRRIRDYQSRQRHYRQENQTLRKKIDSNSKDNQIKISDLRKQIQDRYQKQTVEGRIVSSDQKDNKSSRDYQFERNKKNKYIEQQLAEQIKKIQAQKQKQYKRDIQSELKYEVQKHHLRQKQKQKEKSREKQRERFGQREKDRDTQRHKERSKSLIKQTQNDNKQYIYQLEDEKQELRQKLQIKDQQLSNIVLKLQRAQKQIGKLEDQNIQLRKTKSSLLKEVEGMTFKQQGGQTKLKTMQSDHNPIQQYQKMIINERKQIVDERLRAEIQQLKTKARKQQKQFKQKLQQKQMEIMKLRLSQKSALRQKQVYSNRIKQIMDNAQGERKTYLQALDGAHRFETQTVKAKQLQTQNNELQQSNQKLIKQKEQLQKAIKKHKSRLDERQGQWVRLKSIESQCDYYKTQCQKFQKAHKKFEKQYQTIRQYCQNLEHVVGRKPRKTFDQEINGQRQERYKTQIRNRLQVLIQEVKQMQNKFYLQQIQIWLTQRTNLIQYYAKKYQDEKARILDTDNINQQAKANLIVQKQKQIIQLKDQQINDIDKKIAKIRVLIKNEEQKLVSTMVDKASFEQIVGQLTEKLQKIRVQQQGRKKQITTLKQKNIKLQSELKQKITRLNSYDADPIQKRSLSLFNDEKEGGSKFDDGKKSYLDQFKKSRDFYMNKPFEELKKLNSDLQAQKRKVEAQMNSIKFNFDKQKVQLNDKIRSKQRQMKKMQLQASNNQKTLNKLNIELDALKKNKQQLQLTIKKILNELKQVSRTLEHKQRQCGQLLAEIARMQKNLRAYEQAQKKMFDDVKKMKQKLQKKQQEMEKAYEQNNIKAKQIDAERVIQISKLQQKCKELQYRLQKQITQNLTIKNETQKLSQNITEYDVKLKDKQQELQFLNDDYNRYKIETNEKLQQLQEQNTILQKNIIQIADEIASKQKQCCQFQIKIQYAQKREQVLQKLKDQLQSQNNSFKNIIEQLQKEKQRQFEKFKDQIRSYDLLNQKIQNYVQQNVRLQLNTKQMQKVVKLNQNRMHQLEKQTIRVQGQKKNLQTRLEFLNQKYLEQTKRMQKLEQQIKQRPANRSDQKARRSNQQLQSPTVHRKLIPSGIQRSNSLIQPQKSSTNLQISKKTSIKQKSQLDHLRYSNEGMELNIKKPFKNFNQQIDASKNYGLKKSNNNNNNNSNVNIDVDMSSENQVENRQSNADIAVNALNHVLTNITMNSGHPEVINNSNLHENQSMYQPQNQNGVLNINLNANIGHQNSNISSGLHSKKIIKLQRNELDQQDVQQSEQLNQDNQPNYQQNYQENSQNDEYGNPKEYARMMFQLNQKVQSLRNQVQAISDQKNRLQSELKIYQDTYGVLQNVQKSRHNTSNINKSFHLNVNSAKKSQNIINQSNLQSGLLQPSRINELNKQASMRSFNNNNLTNQQSNQQIMLVDRSNFNKIEGEKQKQRQRQIQQLNAKLQECQIEIANYQSQIKHLQSAERQGQQARNNLMQEIKSYVHDLQVQVKQKQELTIQLNDVKNELFQKTKAMQQQIEQLVLQDIKKDQSMNQTMKIINKLNQQIRFKDRMMNQLNIELQQNKISMQVLNKKINDNKTQYRKYQQQAQLQILHLKQERDQLNLQIKNKQMQYTELAQRFLQAQEKLQSQNKELQSKDYQILVQRSKIKQAYQKRDQALEQIRRFEASRTNVLNRLSQMQKKLGEKNQQIKQLTKQTAISNKKYQIQIQTQKQEHQMTKNRLKQREQHITKLKLELANYNEVCHDLERQKGKLDIQINKLTKQLKQVMVSYQVQLEQLNKDKLNALKMLDLKNGVLKELEAKIQVLNSQLSRRGRENKQLVFKVQQREQQLQKTKEKHQKQKGSLIVEIQLKNDQLQKLKVQLQRQTEHYFTKQCEYLADKQKKDNNQRQYHQKLEGYERILKELEEEVKELHNRPAVEQWEEVCFENELYKNRVQELEELLRETGQQNEDKYVGEFRRYKLNKERQIEQLSAQMQKYSLKLHNLQENNYVLKKDNDSMKIQLRLLMQQKIKMQKTIKQYEEDIQQLKEQVGFYKAKRVQDLNKLLNQTYD